MTTLIHETSTEVKAAHTLGVLRLAATGAVASGLFFILCWIGAIVSVTGASHMYIALFTSADVASASALGEGLCWSLLFGLVAGSLVAFFYNVFDILDRN